MQKTRRRARRAWALVAVVWSLAATAAGAAAYDELDPAASQQAVAQLETWLKLEESSRTPWEEQPFRNVPLTKEDAAAARLLLWNARRKALEPERTRELKENVLVIGKLRMKLADRVFGKPPEGGMSLFLSLHGGGGAPARVNDAQWRNQQVLYRLKEGIYVAPRAPTNTWNMWHQPHIDRFVERLIENYVIVHGVNSNRVYLLGYSAGGDGVYQLAPRMADRFAAAAMMAGHPNDASPLSLRNLPFAIHVGENDRAYKRNQVAAEWGQRLDALQKEDPEGYPHVVKLHKGKGHWMDREDAEALEWMAHFRRNPVPKKVVWHQDDVTHERFYWLGVAKPKPRTTVRAEVAGQAVEVFSDDVPQVELWLDDRLVDLDRKLRISANGKLAYYGHLPRTIDNLYQSLSARGDPELTFCSRWTVPITGEEE